MLRTAVPAGRREGRRRPAPTSSASAPTSPRAPWCRCAATGRRCASSTEFADRPHAYVKLWRHHSPQPQADRINAVAAQRGESWLPRYGGLISSEWEFAKALEILRGGPAGVPGDGPVRRGRRLDRLAAVRHLRPQRVQRGLQGHPAGRPVPVARSSSPRCVPDFADFVTEKLDHPIGRLGDRAGSLTAQAAEWTGLPRGHPRRGRQRRCARHRRGGRRAGVGTTGGDHGHVDLSRDELRRAARRPGHVRGCRRRDRRRQLGIRGRAVRRRRHLRLVRRQLRARELPRRGPPPRRCRCTTTSPSWPAASGSANTAWSPWTGTAETVRCWSITNCPAS